MADQDKKDDVVSIKRDELAALIAQQAEKAGKEAAKAALEAEAKARADAEAKTRADAEAAEKAKADADAKQKEFDAAVEKKVRDFLSSVDTPDRVPVAGSEPKVNDRRLPVLSAQVKNWRDRYQPETLEWVNALCRGPVAFEMHQAKMRAPILTTANDASGGEHLLPEELAMLIERTLWQNVGWTKAVKIFPTNEANGKWPKISDVSVAMTAEGAAFTESTPTISRTQWNAWKLGGYAKVSLETIEDASFDIVSEIVERFGKAIAEEVDKQLLVGQNSSAPYGLYYNVVGTGMTATTYAVGGAITYQALVALEHTLKREYRKGAVFVGDDAILKYIQRLVDSNGRPIFERAIEAGEPPRVLSYPFIVSARNSLPTTHLFFGDPQKYYVMWRNGMSVDMSKDAADPSGSTSAFLEDELWVKTRVRLDGILSDAANAFTCGTGITG